MGRTSFIGHDGWLVLDFDARPIAGPTGPMICTRNEAQSMIGKGEAFDMAPAWLWKAVFGPVPGDGPGAWKLIRR